MNPEGEVQPEEQKPKHSGYGIASFTISIVNGFVMLIFIVLFTGLIPLVGLVLGLVGLRQQNFRKQFCKLGIGLNGIHLFLGVAVLLLRNFGIAF